ncbi:MAG TPA: hypothetical protein VK784_05320 [Pseudonocardiaceae bacterium]|jgi:hypothetical protein|nr:hypothetical protein [Pseudonocardiaceae bacterium]
MSSTQVPLWVPVIVALLGFIGVLGAQVVATWRDDRRWRREAEREELRWKRDRSREKDNRSYEDRQRAYRQLRAEMRQDLGFDVEVLPGHRQLGRLPGD